jgi:hypothetical protein
MPQGIPTKLRDAFSEAIAHYGSWRSGEPEPEISLDMHRISISRVCVAVTAYDDPIDSETWSHLARCVRRVDGFPPERTFASAAQFLKCLIDERAAKHRRRSGSE